MSWRIEEADALALLRELPDGWAQICVADRRAAATPNARSRSWPRYAACFVTTARCGFSSNASSCRSPPSCARKAGRSRRRRRGRSAPREMPTVQRHGCSCSPSSAGISSTLHTIAARDRSSSALCVSMSRQARRVQTCIPAREHERGLALIKRCILASFCRLRVGRAARPTSAPGPVRALSQSGVRRARTTTPAGAVWYSTRSMTGPASRPPRRRSTPGAASSGSPSPQRRVSADDRRGSHRCATGRSPSQSAPPRWRP